jgi:hypothetical protein
LVAAGRSLREAVATGCASGRLAAASRGPTSPDLERALRRSAIAVGRLALANPGRTLTRTAGAIAFAVVDLGSRVVPSSRAIVQARRPLMTAPVAVTRELQGVERLVRTPVAVRLRARVALATAQFVEAGGELRGPESGGITCRVGVLARVIRIAPNLLVLIAQHAPSIAHPATRKRADAT